MPIQRTRQDKQNNCWNPRCFYLFILFAVSLPTVLLAEVIEPSKAKLDEEQSTAWYDIRLLEIEGRGWDDTKSFYDRLPAKAEGVVREPVWELSEDSSGIAVRFQTDATTIKARWSVRSKTLAYSHMPATCASGLDLYVRLEDGTWRWIGVGRPEEFPTNESTLITGIPPGKREYYLYLPLYNGVTSVEIGSPKKVRSKQELQG